VTAESDDADGGMQLIINKSGEYWLTGKKWGCEFFGKRLQKQNVFSIFDTSSW
jgi:hypothetical protein